MPEPDPPGVGDSSSGSAGIGGGAPTSPVAVVWCRQVDNEAESPGYTTIPEEFPGHAETLDAIRIVGNLTVNVADTHDYWDPDPSQPLSYYPNLFLFPAYGGRYTCVGRMFLSTEDRPRLGMKTLVLDTAQLLASGEYGATVLRWHASMGGARPPGTKPPVSDPKLYGLVGEGFLFHRGSTDPVLVIAGDDWDGAMQVILDMVRVLPGSLVALGAILAFPYFLPQPKTNLHEFTEQLPLALTLMRVPRREAVGERHAQRIAAWEGTSLTVRDLTQDAPASRAKETLPLVLQYVRDQALSKLAPVVQRVDLVEGERRRAQLFDPEHQGGKDRRKEMWRVGTAMESAALLLSRARGRHVPVNVETARRAQQYLQARVPQADTAAADVSPAPSAVVAPEATSGSGQLPPWLARGEPAIPARSDRVEVVPMPHSDDPSLLPKPSVETVNLPEAVVVPVVVTTAEPPPPLPPPAPVDVAQLRADIERDLLRYIEQRWSTSGPPPGAPAVSDERFLEFERRMNERLAAAMDQAVARATADRGRGDATAAGLEALRRTFEQKLQDVSSAQTLATSQLGSELSRRIEDSTNRSRLTTLQDIAGAETRLRGVLSQELTQEVDRRAAALLELRLAEITRRIQQSGRPNAEELATQIREQMDKLSADLRHQVDQKEEELRHGLAAQLDLHLREAAEREEALKQSVGGTIPTLVEPRLREQEARVQKLVREAEQRQAASVDGRVRDLQERWAQRAKDDQDRIATAVDAKLTDQAGKFASMTDARVEEVGEANRHAIADLQVRMEAHLDQRIGEGLELERSKYLELLARLKGDIDQAWTHAYDSPRFDQAVRDRLTKAFETFQSDWQKTLEARVTAAETRLRTEQASGLHRLEEVEKTLEARGKELFRVEESIRTDLDDLDQRLQTLSDRLVPIVQKTWLRIGELEKARTPSEETAAKVESLRRDFTREVRRLQQELVDRTTDIRERMETTIANQGKVWLAVIRQMSHNAVERSTNEHRAVAHGRAADDEFALDALPPDEESFDRFTDYPDSLGNRGAPDGARGPRRRRPVESSHGG